MIGPRLLGRSHVDMGLGNAESQHGRSGDSWFRSALDGCSGQRVEYIGKPSQHLGLRRPISIQVQYGVVSRMPVVVEMPSSGVCLQTGNDRRASTPPGLPLCLSMISKVPTAGVNFGAEETASLTRRDGLASQLLERLTKVFVEDFATCKSNPVRVMVCIWSLRSVFWKNSK